MKKININVDDKVLVKTGNIEKIVLVARVNRSTFLGLDIDNNLEIYFIKEIIKKISTQKRLDLEFENNDSLIQLSLF